MADPQQETFTDVQPIQQKAAPAADASAPQETFTDVTPIAVSKPPIAALPKNYSKPDDLPKAAGAPVTPSGEKAATQEGMHYTGVIAPIKSEEQRKVITTPTATENHIAAPFIAANEKADKMAQAGAEAGREAGAGWVQGASGGASGMSPTPRQTPLTDEQSRALNPTATGIAEGVGGFIGGTVADPRQVAMLVAAMPVAEAGPIFSRVLAAGFAANMGKDTYEGVKALQKDWASLTEEQRGERMGQLGITGLLTAATAYHASGFEPKTPEVKQAEANVKALEADRATAQAAYDKALAEHNKHTASHAQGIQSPEKVVKELNKTKAALDEATAHHELAKEALASKVAAQRAGAAGGKPAVSVKPTPAPAPEVPTEAIEAQPSPLKPLGTPEPAPALPAINVKTPGQIQPETFPQTPTEQPRTPLGRIELAGGQGTMGKPPLLTEGTPEGPQLPPGGLPQIKMPEAPKPAPQPAAVDEAALRALSAKEGKVVETPEKKVGRLLQEALKPEKKTEYKGEERRKAPTTNAEMAYTGSERRNAAKDTAGVNATIARDQNMPKSPAEEFSEKKAVEKPKEVFYRGTNAEEAKKIEETGKITPDAFSSGHITPDKSTAEAYAKQNGGKVYSVNAEHVPEKDLAHYRETGRGPITLSSEVPTVEHTGRPTVPKEEGGYKAKNEEVAKEKPSPSDLAKTVKGELIGSHATGKATPESDVDIKVEKPVDEDALKQHGYEYQSNSRVSPKEAAEYDKPIAPGWSNVQHFTNPTTGSKVDVWSSEASPNEEPTGYAAKKEEVVPVGEEGREPAKTAEEYHAPVRQKVFELGNDDLRKLAQAHGIDPTEEKYAFGKGVKRTEATETSTGRAQTGRHALSDAIVDNMSDDEKVNIGRAAEAAEKEPGFENRDRSGKANAERAAKLFPRLREGYGEANTGVTKEDYEAAKKSFNDKATRSNAGIDPTMLADAAKMAAYHFEAGVRTFTEFSRKMVRDLGEAVRPHLEKLWADQVKANAERAAKYANPEKGIPETSLAKGPEAEAMHAATVASDKLAEEWKTANEEKPKTVDVAKHASDYNKAEGLPEIKPEKVEKSPRAKEIADAYTAMKHNPNDPEVKKSYAALIDDVKKQWDYATNKMGIKIEPTDKDPYNSYEELRDDVKNNKTLKVFKGGNPLPEDHPLAKVDPKTGETYNTMFRAVHDLFGHLTKDNDFSENGEENAWNTHRQMMSPEAVPAMTTETRGQTSWFFNHGEKPGTFAEQKAGILPDFANAPTPDAKATLDHIRSGKDFAVLTAENPNNERSTPEENEKRNRALVEDLRKKGYEPVPVEGNTKDVEGQKEHSYFVPDITPKEAAELGRKHGQAAVLTTEGLHDLKTNTINPSDNKKLMLDDEARKQPYYTKVGDRDFSVPIDFDKTVKPGEANYHGEPLSYEYDNGNHKVVTTDKDGKKIGELLAKNIAPNTVEVVSNQVYDKDLRGKGRGVDQIQHLLEKVGDDIKSVKSDISTTKDARAAWDKLEKFAPEAVTKKTFKDGQVQYSVDMDKWRGEHSPQSVGSARAGTSLAKESPLTAKQLQERLPDLAQKHLTPEEKESITTTATGKPRSAGTAKFVQNMTNIPSVQEYTDIALAGEGARKWYSRSTAAFDAMHEEAPDYFKEGDKDKFMGVLAGSSPQQSVAMNLREALGFWKEWNDAGRPVPTLDKWKQFGEEADKAWKEDGSPRSKGLKTGASMHWDYAPQGPEWKAENLFVKNLTLPDTKMPNIIKALRGEDMWPDLTKNAAFKAPSFAENLRKWINGKNTGTKYVTNDSWMGLFGGIDKSALSKPENYHPLSVATRAAAEELGWEPEEAQAAIWSFTQTLTEKGEEDPEIIRQYSEDFKDLLANDEQTRSKLEDLGVNLDQLDKKLEAIGEKPEISGRSTATTSRSIEQLKQRIEEARGKGAIPPAKSAQGELGFREPHPTRTPVDEAVGFDPEKFRTQTDEPLTKLGEKKKKSPFGTIR